MTVKSVCALLSALATVFSTTAGAASATEFPTRPIRLILPVGPGGGQDTTARAMNHKLTEELGQSVVIDPRPGGGGNIAAVTVARATPDGHTLLNISTTAVTTPLVYDAPYDLQRDFTAVSQLVANPYLLVTAPSLPVKSVGELIAYAKANPDKLSFASAGSGSLTHLGLEILKAQTGISMTHVPYKGMGPSGPDLMSGRVHLGLWSIVSAQPHVRAGRLKALAVSGVRRARAAPDVPTIGESGVPGFAVTQWYGVVAPARTPRPIVDRLSRALATSIQDPEVAVRIAHDGAEPVGNSPQEFAAHLKAEHAKWAEIVRRTGIRDQVREAR